MPARLALEPAASGRPSAESLAVCRGTRLANADELKRGYLADAFVPTGDWRPLDEIEHASLVGVQSRPRQRGETVELLLIPRRTVDFLRSATRADAALPAARFLDDSGLSSVIDWGEPRRLVGSARDDPDLPTTTWDSGRGGYLGLHVDSWDRLPSSRRLEATNRISINIGETERHLLFLAPLISELSTCAEDPLMAPELVELTLRQRSDLSVFRLRIDPGQAYIAPTENIIHDGSTAGTGPSQHFTLRGHIVAKASRSGLHGGGT